MRDYVLTLLVAAAVTYLLTPLVRRGAIRAGIMFEPRARDVHTGPVPRGGGVAMYFGLAAGLLVADQLPPLRSGFAQTGMVPGLLLAGALLVVVGIIDDRWGLSAILQLVAQIGAGAILVATGTQLLWLPWPGGGTLGLTPDESTLLTILVVVATINAVNFIDGLDGLAAGIVAISAISFLIYYYSMTRVLGLSELAAPALASAILVGMCLGFLPHNFHPARIFMGTPGSMLIGLVLAYAPISSIPQLTPTNLQSQINRYPEIMPLLLPAALLVIPYADLLLAVLRRTKAGLSPFANDRKHIHHRLLDIGHSQRSSVLVMYLWAALFSGTIVWFSLERTRRPKAPGHHGQPLVVFVLITAAAVVALLLMSLPRLRKQNRLARAAAQAAGPVPAGLGDQASVGAGDQALAAVGQPLPAPVTVGAVAPASREGRADRSGRGDRPSREDRASREDRPSRARRADRPAAGSRSGPVRAEPEGGTVLNGAGRAELDAAGIDGAGIDGAGLDGAGLDGAGPGAGAEGPDRSEVEGRPAEPAGEFVARPGQAGFGVRPGDSEFEAGLEESTDEFGGRSIVPGTGPRSVIGTVPPAVEPRPGAWQFPEPPQADGVDRRGQTGRMRSGGIQGSPLPRRIPQTPPPPGPPARHDSVRRPATQGPPPGVSDTVPQPVFERRSNPED